MASMTRELCVAWKHYGVGLTALQAGALWALAALAEEADADGRGRVRIERAALAEVIGVDGDGAAGEALDALRRRGRVRFDDAGQTLEIEVRMWSDARAKKLANKRERRST